MNTPTKAIRSPSYPGMALRDAVAAVAKIEKLYRSSPVDRTNAAKLIGYSSLSGPANKALAALAAFGLFDRAGKGEARVTERARDILHAQSEEQRNARLLEAAMEPALFRELRERFEGMASPPEDGVITYLNRQGFNPNAVRPAARAFLETLSYLEEIGATESHGATLPGGRESDEQSESAMSTQQPQPYKPASQPQASSQSGATVHVPAAAGNLRLRQAVFPVGDGDVTLTYPARISPEGCEELRGYIDMFLKGIKRTAEANRRAEEEFAPLGNEDKAGN